MINRQEWLNGLQVGDAVLHHGKPTKILEILQRDSDRTYFTEQP